MGWERISLVYQIAPIAACVCVVLALVWLRVLRNDEIIQAGLVQGWRLEGGRGQPECGKLEGPPTHQTPLQNLQKIFSLIGF